jgi:hypothetical protein
MFAPRASRAATLSSPSFKILALLFLFASLSAVVSAREQVVIQKGTNGNAQLRGGSLFMDEGSPTTSTNSALNVKAQNGARQRSYVLFDLSSLPTIAVKAATLTLHVKTAPLVTRTYGVHNVTSFSTLTANWTNRATDSAGKTTAWTAAGGDFNGTATNTQSVGQLTTSVSFTLTGDAQNWYDGTANYGTLIKDENEGSGGGNNVTTVFNSFADAAVANRPSLTITYLQNVQNLTATPGNASVALNWSYPTTTNNLSGESYAGVIILRRAGAPVDKNSLPTDTQAPPALCSTIGSGTLVFVGTMSNTSFTDNGACSALTNGTQYFYKVFLRDNLNYYSSNVVASTYTAETAAVPGTVQALTWTLATHSYNLGGGGLIPGTQMDFGSDTSQLFSIDLSTGQRAYPAVGLGGTVSARPPILDSTVAANGKQAAYVTAQDGNIYAIDTSTTGIGQILWFTNLSATGTAGNIFMGGAAVQVKQYSTASYTPTYDTIFVGTHNSSTTSGNSVVALNGTTGAVLWTFTGTTTTKLDMINSTPTVDYTNNAVWVTSHSNAVTTQPNLWKFNPLNNTVGWSMNLGNAGDIDSSPSLTQNGDVLFVGTNSGNLYALNPAATTSGTALLATYTGTDGAVKSYPYIVTTVNPYTVVFTTGTMVHAVSFNKNTNTFTKLWDSTTFTSPSAPVVYNFSKIYIGTGSDIIYELDLASGIVTAQRTVDTGNNPMFIGEPSLDLVLNRIYVTTTTNDQRSYAYTVPF